MMLPIPPSYTNLKLQGRTLWLQKGQPLEPLEDLLGAFWKGEGLPASQLLKQDSPATVWAFEMEGRKWVLKAYRPRNLLRSLWDGWTGSRAFHALSLASCFSQKGISTPLPLAALSGDSQAGSCLITPYLEGYEDLRDYTSKISQNQKEGACLITQLALWIGKMHREHLYHGDLKSVNIFLRKGEGRLDFSVIDLDGAKRGSSFSLNRTAKDLSALLAYMAPWAGERGILRFALAYEKALKLPRKEGGKLFSKALQKAGDRERKGKSLPPDFTMPRF